MHDDVVRTSIEPESRETAEGAVEALLLVPMEDEIEVCDADVVPPHMDLFHTVERSARADELAYSISRYCRASTSARRAWSSHEVRFRVNGDPLASPVRSNEARGRRKQSPPKGIPGGRARYRFFLPLTCFFAMSRDP